MPIVNLPDPIQEGTIDKKYAPLLSERLSIVLSQLTNRLGAITTSYRALKQQNIKLNESIITIMGSLNKLKEEINELRLRINDKNISN